MDDVAAVVGVVAVAVSVGAGVSFVRVVWLSAGIGGKSAWALFGWGVVCVEAVGWDGAETCGCMSTKAKQNTDMISSGGPIRNRCELVICLGLSITYCAKLCLLRTHLPNFNYPRIIAPLKLVDVRIPTPAHQRAYAFTGLPWQGAQFSGELGAVAPPSGRTSNFEVSGFRQNRQF